MIEVLEAGGLTTVQDLGRRGWAHIGVPPSGAADAGSLRLANRLVGNREDAPALEATLTGPVLRFHAPAVVALAGAVVEARADRRPLAMHATEHVRAGETVRVGTARRGLRTYLAVRGGIAAERVLGSAATDVLTGLGPEPLRAGARLSTASAAADWPAATLAPVPALGPEPPVLRIVCGPRDDWFTPEALKVLCRTRWEVAPASNRIGVRLRGPSLERARTGELASEGMLAGALQVPPSGPILLLADHPTTGGYPVIAVVATADLPRAGQLRPGDGVRFAVA